MRHRGEPALWIAGALLIGLWLRAPQVGAGLPYLYDHDEGPHFNRVVQMIQEGRFDPQYFLKPSLHFYLRMPAVAAGFLHTAQAGEIRSIQEVVTANHSVQGTARTASHPRIVMWARSVTTAFSLLLVLLTYLVARRVATARWVAGVAALLVAITPPLIEDSEKVGVDTLMATMCLLTVWLSLRVMEQPTVARAALAGIAAGLSVSSKYNAMPVVVVPILAVLLSDRRSTGAMLAALTLPAVGFVAGTPYALINPPGLLDGMATEIIHYATGHTGVYVEPGWPHTERFLLWMFTDASGVAVTVAGLAGALLLPLSQKRTGPLILSFPILFGLYMLSQRVAFFRNMFVLLPFFAVAAVWLIERTAERLERKPWLPQRVRVALVPTLVVILSAQPAVQAFDIWRQTGTFPESRRLVTAWLADNTAPDVETAVAADLQLSWPDYSLPGVLSLRSDELADPVALFLNGFDRLVAGPSTERRLSKAARSLLQVRMGFDGNPNPSEVPRNPAVTVYDLLPTLAHSPEVRARVEREDRFAVTGGVVRTRVARFAPDDTAGLTATTDGSLNIALWTPWSSQSCHLEVSEWRSRDLCAGLAPDTWVSRSIDIPAEAAEGDASLWIVIKRVHRDPAAPRDRRNQRIGLVIKQ